MQYVSMDLVIIALAALGASCLTFFSGFGLGTILMPVFVLFFPIDTAIALTAVVHFLNNMLKLAILWRKAKWSIVVRFGLPAFAAAFLGALVLLGLEGVPPLIEYQIGERWFSVTVIKLVMAVLIVIFALLEMLPSFQKITFPPKWLPVGGILSGFFGGLSGHQGALRSMFLLKAGLSKEEFIATGVVIACLVDASRISVYWQNIMKAQFDSYMAPLVVAIAFSFAGVFLGSRLMKKVTMKTVQRIVSVMLFIIAVLLGSGLI